MSKQSDMDALFDSIVYLPGSVRPDFRTAPDDPDEDDEGDDVTKIRATPGGNRATDEMPIVKMDEDQRLVWGWASVITKAGQHVQDFQGDMIDVEELRKAAHDFMTHHRVSAAMHKSRSGKQPTREEVSKGVLQTGGVVESVVFTNELQKALGIDLGMEGWLIGVKVENEDVWKRVKSGELRAFSIGGSASRVPVGKYNTNHSNHGKFTAGGGSGSGKGKITTRGASAVGRTQPAGYATRNQTLAEKAAYDHSDKVSEAAMHATDRTADNAAAAKHLHAAKLHDDAAAANHEAAKYNPSYKDSAKFHEDHAAKHRAFAALQKSRVGKGEPSTGDVHSPGSESGKKRKCLKCGTMTSGKTCPGCGAKTVIAKYNPNHGSDGRFASGSGGGAPRHWSAGGATKAGAQQAGVAAHAASHQANEKSTPETHNVAAVRHDEASQAYTDVGNKTAAKYHAGEAAVHRAKAAGKFAANSPAGVRTGETRGTTKDHEKAFNDSEKALVAALKADPATKGDSPHRIMSTMARQLDEGEDLSGWQHEIDFKPRTVKAIAHHAAKYKALMAHYEITR